MSIVQLQRRRDLKTLGQKVENCNSLTDSCRISHRRNRLCLLKTLLLLLNIHKMGYFSSGYCIFGQTFSVKNVFFSTGQNSGEAIALPSCSPTLPRRHGLVLVSTRTQSGPTVRCLDGPWCVCAVFCTGMIGVYRRTRVCNYTSSSVSRIHFYCSNLSDVAGQR